MNVEAIKAAWAEWDAASAATEEALDAFAIVKRSNGLKSAAYRAGRLAWEATLDRTDAARKGVAGLPDLDEVAAWEAEQAAIAEVEEKQGKLF